MNINALSSYVEAKDWPVTGKINADYQMLISNIKKAVDVIRFSQHEQEDPGGHKVLHNSPRPNDNGRKIICRRFLEAVQGDTEKTASGLWKIQGIEAGRRREQKELEKG